MSKNNMVKMLLTAFVVAMALVVSGSMAFVSTTVSGGATVTGTGSGGNLVVNSAGTSASAAVSMGSFVGAYSILDSAGKEIDLSLDVPQADKISYAFSTPDKTSTNSVYATIQGKQTFSVTNADSLQASLTAQNAEGDIASTSLYGNAYNSPMITVTNVVQSGSASASSVTASETIASGSVGYDLWGYGQSQNALNMYAETDFGVYYNGNFKSLSQTANAAKGSVSATGSLGSVVTPVGGQMYFEAYANTPKSGKDAWLEVYNQPKSVTTSNLMAATAASGMGTSASVQILSSAQPTIPSMPNQGYQG